VLLSVLRASRSSSSPFLSPQDARRCFLDEILQFSPQNLGCGAASTGTPRGVLLAAYNNSLTEIKILLILPKSCTALSRMDLIGALRIFFVLILHFPCWSLGRPGTFPQYGELEAVHHACSLVPLINLNFFKHIFSLPAFPSSHNPLPFPGISEVLRGSFESRLSYQRTLPAWLGRARHCYPHSFQAAYLSLVSPGCYLTLPGLDL